jgi:hypothetical protein
MPQLSSAAQIEASKQFPTAFAASKTVMARRHGGIT